MNERTRLWFEEISRASVFLLLSVMFSIGFFNGVGDEVLIQTQILLASCLVVSAGLLAFQMRWVSGEISLSAYSGLKTLPLKGIMWMSIGAFLSSFLLWLAGPMGWGLLLLGVLGANVGGIVLWFKKE